MNEKFENLLIQAEHLLGRIEAILPQALSVPDWSAAIAYRYRKRSSGHGTLEPVRHIGVVRLADLKEIEPQKERIQRNTHHTAEHTMQLNLFLQTSRHNWVMKTHL